MSRAPYVVSKSNAAFGRSQEMYDTSIGWRFVHPKMEEMGHTDPLGITAETVAQKYGISREAQDQFALQSQQRWASAQERGLFADELVPVSVPQRKGDPLLVDIDEHPRPSTTAEALAKLRPAFTKDPSGSVTAGNASGVNDGAAALILMDADRAKALGLRFWLSSVPVPPPGLLPRKWASVRSLPSKKSCSGRTSPLMPSILWNSMRPLRLKRLRVVRRWAWISPK